ncbi:hyaluronidase-like isoform X1 [Protopterus annectens]|uniref:hyaluronidase-like isoform X1 n=1 Tax=Protopterus annectens TaxID=7888 RepID=UPI001CFC3BF4|nr:hyaluronidase-like isoform X1 [Protopterus annectens]
MKELDTLKRQDFSNVLTTCDKARGDLKAVTLPSLKHQARDHCLPSHPFFLTFSSVDNLIYRTAVCFFLMFDLTETQNLKLSLPPVMANQPFSVFWNAPTDLCQIRYDMSLNLDSFGIIKNQNEALTGNNVTIFYYDQLGLYPFYDNSTAVNGGCPQNASLQNHCTKMIADVKKMIPSDSFRGLSVIDWENWRPQWVRNWDKKDIYRKQSQELVKVKNPHLTKDQIPKQAQWEFDSAAQNFMTESLRLTRSLKPHGWWGYYLFPDCYNYDYATNFENFTGQCPDIEIQRNNELLWLWQQSKALYPSIYMEEILKSSEQGRKFVRARIREAMRVADMPDSKNSLPVFVYSRPVYAYTFKQLTMMDLVHTIGESAALGAHGVVLWGDIEFSRNTTNCMLIRDYIRSVLGPYVINVTKAAELCSQFTCNKNGRCLRKNPETNSYLHLDGQIFQIQEHTDRHSISFNPIRTLREQIQKMGTEFQCQCYEGWMGERCNMPESTGTRPQLAICIYIAAFCGMLTWDSLLCGIFLFLWTLNFHSLS